MNILLVDDESDIKEILQFILESSIDCVIDYAPSGNDAIECLKNKSDYQLIICDLNMPNGTGGDVYSFLLKENYKIPFSLCSSSFPEDNAAFNDRRLFLSHIIKPDLFEGVEKTLLALKEFEIESGTKGASFDEKLDDYVSIGIELLRDQQINPVDLFLSIDGKMLKILHQDDSAIQETLSKYRNKGINEFQIKKNDVKVFASKCYFTVNQLVNESILKNEKKENILDAHTIVMECLRRFELSSELLTAARQAIDAAVSCIGKNKDLANISSLFVYKNKSYLTEHSFIAGCISCSLLSVLDWDSSEVRKKLVIASFLHDYPLSNDLSIESKYKPSNSIAKKQFVEHPLRASELVAQIEDLDSNTQKIVFEHHELPDGSGFPKKLHAAQISPLSAVFIFAHNIAEIICEMKLLNLKMNRNEAEKHLDRTLFSIGQFSKILEAYDKIKIFDHE